MNHLALAKKAVEAVFSNTNKPKEETVAELKELRDEIDQCLEALDDR